jgi:hypothetical protein
VKGVLAETRAENGRGPHQPPAKSQTAGDLGQRPGRREAVQSGRREAEVRLAVVEGKMLDVGLRTRSPRRRVGGASAGAFQHPGLDVDAR